MRKKDKNIVLKAILYLFMMPIGGIIFYYFYYSGLPVSVLIRFSLELFLPSLLIGFILEGGRWGLRRWKNSKGTPAVRNPFWFDWIEASFSVWLLWLLALVIRAFI